MKICLGCGCQIVKMHRTDADCLKALSVQIPSLQKRLRELEAAQQRMQSTSPMPPENFEVREVSWDQIEKDFEEGASG